MHYEARQLSANYKMLQNRSGLMGMLCRSPVYLLRLSLPLLLLPFSLQAYNDGIFGRYDEQASNSCGLSCHAGGNNSHTGYALQLNKDINSVDGFDLSKNFAHTLTLRIDGTGAAAGGFNLHTDQGDFTTGSGSKVNPAPDPATELTHSAIKAAASGDVEWSFTYNAPDSTGTVTFQACGLPTNGSGSTGDGIAGGGRLCGTFVANLVNDPPVADDETSDQVGTVAEDSSLSIPFSTLLTGDTDVNGDTLSVTDYDVNSVTTGVTLTVDGNAFSYDPHSIFNGLDVNETATDSFQYIVSDGSLTANGTVTVTIEGVNDAPLAGSEAEVITVNIAGTATTLDDARDNLLDNDSDPDTADTALSAILVQGQGPVYGLLTLNSDGTFSYTHDGSSNDPDSFQYQISDDSNALSEIVTVNIVVVNNVPTANDDTNIDLLEYGSVNVKVLDNDVNGEEPPSSALLSIVSITNVINGLDPVIEADQSITFFHNGAELPAASFQYQVTDGFFSSNPATVTFNVEQQNDAPVITDGDELSVEMSEDGLLEVPLEVTDDDNIDISWDIITPAMHGSAVVSGSGKLNTVQYQPDENYTGADSFIVEVSDSLLTDTIQVTVDVKPVNDPPEITEALPLTVVMDEDDPSRVVLTLHAIDNDNDTIYWSIVSPGSSHGTASVSAVSSGTSQDISYVPNPDYNGDDSFIVRVTANAQTDERTVNVTVNPVEDAPLITQGQGISVNISEDSDPNPFAALQLDAVDVDGDDLSWDVITTGTIGSPSLAGTGNSRIVNYTPQLNQTAADSFIVRVTDTDGLSADFSVNISIIAINDAPQISEGDIIDISLSEDQNPTPFSLTLHASDAENQTINWTIATPASHGTASLNSTPSGTSQEIHYIPEEQYSGTDNFRVKVSDGVSSNEIEVRLTIENVNDAPSLAAINDISLLEEAVMDVITAIGIDPDDANDGSELIYSLSNAPAGMAISNTFPTQGQISWTAPKTGEFDKVYGPIVVSVADGGENNAGPATQSFSITVNPPDRDNDQVADYDDFCPSQADSSNADNDGDGTAGSDSSVDDLTGGDVCDSDDDNDGMPDSYELANNLDPLDDSDAFSDKDGDGITNLDEFLAGSNPLFATVTVDATGYLTPVSLPVPAVTYFHANAIKVVNDNPGFFRPGRHEVTWTALDSSNSALSTSVQVVNVIPLVNFAANQQVLEGNIARVVASINGDASEYPVTVEYSVAGSADSNDHDAASGTISITEGETSAELSINVQMDDISDPDETIVLQLTTASHAVIGSNKTHTVFIREGNIAPQLRLSILQNGQASSQLYVADGEVTVLAEVSDQNTGQSHQIDWTASDNALLPPVDMSTSSWTFTPQSGVFVIDVLVSDNGSPLQQKHIRKIIKINDVAPILLDTADSDLDGINDLAEGYADIDQDGVPDYLDALNQPDLLVDQSNDATDSYQLQTEPGLTLALGQTGLAAGRFGASINNEDVEQFGSQSGAAVANAADSFEHISGIYDFEISGLIEGDSAYIVIPLQTALPRDSVIRKYSETDGWSEFVEDAAGNIVSSAVGERGICPQPGDAQYQPGLGFLHNCIQLLIEDGGVNDQDHTADGVIRDPSTVAFELSETQQIKEVRKGGSLTTGFLMLLLLSGLLRIYYFRAKKVKLLIAAVAIIFSASLSAQQTEHKAAKIHYNYELTTVFDDNIRRAKYSSNIREDSIVGLTLGVKSIIPLTDYSLLVVDGKIEAEKYLEFNELDNVEYNAGLKYQFAFASKFSSPQYSIKLKLGGKDSRSDMRTANTASLGFDMNKWLSTTIHMRAAYDFKMSDSQSAVFDTEENQFMVNFDVDLSRRDLVYFSYHFIDGDIVSSATPTLNIINISKEIEPDDAFGGVETNQFAYQIEAVSHVFTLGYNRAVSRTLSLDVSVRMIDSEAKQDSSVYYDRQIIRASVLGRF